MVKINQAAPDFNVKAFLNDEIKEIKLSDYKGKWIVLMFYPADFTFVCPTELGVLADVYSEYRDKGVEFMSVSTDTEYVHKAWYDSSDTVKKIKFPMLADPAAKICRAYGTFIEDEGLSQRGTFIIDPDGVVKFFELHDNDVGRGGEEIVRKLKALMITTIHITVATELMNTFITKKVMRIPLITMNSATAAWKPNLKIGRIFQRSSIRPMPKMKRPPNRNASSFRDCPSTPGIFSMTTAGTTFTSAVFLTSASAR